MFQAAQSKVTGESVGVVFGTFAPLHRGHLDLIMQAKRQNDGGCIVIVSGWKGDRGVSTDANLNFNRRFRYIRELFAQDPLVKVYGLDEEEVGIHGYDNKWNEWLGAFQSIYDIAVQDPRKTDPVFYVSEPEYSEKIKRWNYQVVLCSRDNPISGTAIRKNPIKHWNEITAPFKRVFSTNILITGTASEGKTTLVEDLGRYYGAPYSYEWARGYLEESCLCEQEIGTSDFMAFLEGQYNLNKSLINSPANNGLFFADTDSLVTEMYARKYYEDSAFKFHENKRGLDLIQHTAQMYAEKARWNKIFVLAPNNVFVDDGVRYMGHGSPDIRREMFHSLLNNIGKYARYDDIQILYGGYWENFSEIKKYVDGVIENGKA